MSLPLHQHQSREVADRGDLCGFWPIAEEPKMQGVTLNPEMDVEGNVE